MKLEIPKLAVLAAAVAVGVFFFYVVKPFVLPLIFAAVLAVLFWPLHRRVLRVCRNHRPLAAALTTTVALLIIMTPIAAVIVLAGVQLARTAQEIEARIEKIDSIEELEDKLAPDQQTQLGKWYTSVRSQLDSPDMRDLRKQGSQALVGATGRLQERTMEVFADVFGFLIGLVILSLGLFYFLKDKEQLVTELDRLSPLGKKTTDELKESFVGVCYGVLFGNVLAALVQAVLIGIGFALAGVPGVWLLALLTFFLSMIPFVGATAVWLPVSIGLALNGQYAAAAGLSVYGFVVVGTVDNLVRAYTVHGHTHLHPLVALISILGAVQFVGLWGIIVGPIAGAFFYALLNMIRKFRSKASAQEPNVATRTTLQRVLAGDSQ